MLSLLPHKGQHLVQPLSDVARPLRRVSLRDDLTAQFYQVCLLLSRRDQSLQTVHRGIEQLCRLGSLHLQDSLEGPFILVETSGQVMARELRSHPLNEFLSQFRTTVRSPNVKFENLAKGFRVLVGVQQIFGENVDNGVRHRFVVDQVRSERDR